MTHGLEMSGVLLLIYAMLQHIDRHCPKIQLPAPCPSRSSVLVLCTFMLVGLIGLVGQFSRDGLDSTRLLGVVQWFHLGSEGSIPSWLSSTGMLLAAGLLATIAFTATTDRLAFDHDLRRFWWAASALFFVMSLAEFAGFHEMLISPLREAFGAADTFNLASIVPGILIVLIVLALSARMLLRLPVEITGLLLVSGAIYVGGAIGMDVLGGMRASLPGEASLHHELFVGVAEILEMLGIALFLTTMLEYRRRQVGAKQPPSGPARSWTPRSNAREITAFPFPMVN